MPDLPQLWIGQEFLTPTRSNRWCPFNYVQNKTYFDDVIPVNQDAIRQVETILKNGS